MAMKAEKGEDPALWLFMNSHRDRRFGWVVVRAKDVPQNGPVATFHVDIGDVLKMSDAAQKIFVFALAPNAVSNVHAIAMGGR
jgi:hypothetical protein